MLAGADEFEAMLADEFGIDVDALGPDRLERLWARAVVQHEEHLAADG